MRILFAVAATLTTLAAAQFEVASVKPFQGLATDVYLHVSGPRVTISEYGLLGLVMTAYKVESWQVSGGPPWLESDRFNIVANAPGEAAPTSDQVQQMLQSLLADRFQLKAHREKRERLIYALAVDRKGSKLTPAKTAEPSFTLSGGVRGTRMTFQNRPMEFLALQLSNSGGLGREVVDKTGLTGTYDFTLHWASGNDDEPDLITALQEQLGLKLEPQKAQVEMLVVDHAEKPSAN